ncbi:MAG: hypothetical protein GDA50_02415 [Alphaproteobacteria bacterium GM202ARS2]|nr:hypothetical protein [Alphaproteobacteria bacterium GM202ARS2]
MSKKKDIQIKHGLKKRTESDRFLAQILTEILPTSDLRRALEELWRFGEGGSGYPKRESLVSKYAHPDGTTRVPTTRFHSLFIPLGVHFWLVQDEYFRQWSERWLAMPDTSVCKRLWSLDYERGILINQYMQLIRRIVYGSSPVYRGRDDSLSGGARVLHEEVSPPIYSASEQKDRLQKSKRKIRIVALALRRIEESDNQDETMQWLEKMLKVPSGGSGSSKSRNKA